MGTGAVLTSATGFSHPDGVVLCFQPYKDPPSVPKKRRRCQSPSARRVLVPTCHRGPARHKLMNRGGWRDDKQDTHKQQGESPCRRNSPSESRGSILFIHPINNGSESGGPVALSTRSIINAHFRLSAIAAAAAAVALLCCVCIQSEWEGIDRWQPIQAMTLVLPSTTLYTTDNVFSSIVFFPFLERANRKKKEMALNHKDMRGIFILS